MSTDPSTPENDPNLSALGRELLGTNEGSKPSGPWVPPTAEELHKLLPEYEIVKMLGRGGMGAVYMGKQISLDRPVAIKILSNALEEADASFAERFKNEAKAMGKLSHPGIVAVHDFGETEGGLLYIVMEYVEGTDVAKMIAKSGRLHTEHAMAITAHVCDALGYAHERGIIHRDIKPANIMVGYDGVVKVADFGLAKMTHSQNTGLTQSGMAMGTLHYMAPEALMLGSAVDHRADIYAVGVMLYQMLTGKIPQGMFKLPSLQIPGLDPRYDGIIAKAIMEDREARYQTVRELRGDLDAILTQPVIKVEESAEAAPAVLPTQARPQRPGARQSQRPPQSSAPPPPKARSSGAWLVPAVLAVLALGGGWWWLDREGPSSNNLPPVPEPVGVAEAEPTANSPAKTTSAMPVASAPAPAVMETTKETATDSTPAFFDGKTLSGWTTHGTAVWRVEQGGITSDSGSGMGTISRSLSSPWFDLTGDVYASADGNGGIHFQITDLVTFKDGLEVQICGSKARGRAVGAGGLFAPKLGKAGQRNGKQALLPDAQFTPFRLVVEEGSIRFWLAGEQVFEAKHTLRPEIRTLAFSRLGPEGKVAYRNLRLTLPGEKATKPPTTDNTGKSSRIDGLVANGEWQDVLKIIGGKSAINVGTWSYDNHVLKCTKSSWNASISVPSEALASYSARLRFASSDFRNLTVILPIPKGRMTFAVDVFRNRVGWLTQPGPSAESWPLKQKVADGKEHELLVEVSPGRLLAKIDGTLAYDQANPDWDAIKPLVGYPPGSTVALGVGAHQAVVEFRSFEILIPLAAVGKNTPAPDPQLSPNLQLRPEVATRVANYQKARHAQLTDLTAKYRAALSSEKDAAIKSGVLADATAANGALAAADAFSKVVEASLTSSDVAPLPALAAVADPAPQRLKELR
ncbi:protein kinase, partial [Prosthecobacter sp.]|uniref:protein kinase domain-containing protein n=1 Tax=Prosthecobacter sp. TaxID=1965333 RepID=UPI001D6657D2